MECEVKSTVYTLVGVTDILEDLDDQVVRPINYLRYGIGPADTLAAPKMIVISGVDGQGHGAICDALVNEFRRGSSNKRGHVLYKHRDVKFLNWNILRHDIGGLEKIFVDAKDKEFTVLTIHWFEDVCPAEINHARNPQIANTIKSLIMRQIDAVEIGKLLLVITTTKMAACDQEIIAKANYKYHIALPNADTREEMIWKLLDDENAEVPSSVLDKIVRVTQGYTIRRILRTVGDAVRNANLRQRGRERNSGQQDKLHVIQADWAELDEYDEWDHEDDEGDEEDDEDEEEGEDEGDEEDEDNGEDDGVDRENEPPLPREPRRPRAPPLPRGQPMRVQFVEPDQAVAAAENDPARGIVGAMLGAAGHDIIEEVRREVNRALERIRDEHGLEAGELEVEIEQMEAGIPEDIIPEGDDIPRGIRMERFWGNE